MGMYNEVYKRCPKCGGRGYMQIPQVILGFGDFDLDNPETMEDLTVSELERLQSIISNTEEEFVCQNCHHCFPTNSTKDNLNYKRELINKICRGE